MFRDLNYIKNNIIKHSKETLSKTTILNWTDYIQIYKIKLFQFFTSKSKSIYIEYVFINTFAN